MDRLKLRLEMESLEVETFDPREEVEVADYSLIPVTTFVDYECRGECYSGTCTC